MAVTLWGLTFGDTGTGFVVPTYAEVRDALATRLRQLRGIANLQTQPSSLFGGLIDFVVTGVDLALQSDLDAVSRTIFTSMRGVSLDQFLADILTRVPASESTVVAYAWGSAAAAVGAATALRTSANGVVFATDGAVAIPAAPAEAYAVEIQPFAAGAYAGQAFTITVDGTPVGFTPNVGDDGEDTRNGLATNIVLAGLSQVAFRAGLSPTNGTYALLVIEEGGGGPFVLSVAGPVGQIVSYLAIATPATAAITGPVPCPAEALRYGPPLAGVTGYANPEDEVTGRDAETDSQMRARHQITQRGLGGGSPDAVRAIILSPNLVGLTGGGAAFCSVEYNPTDFVDGVGNLPHSLRVVVDADADGQTVADALWKAKAAGDNTNGTELYVVMDTAVPPAAQDVRIDRLVDVYFAVEITVEIGADWPNTGDPLSQLRSDQVDYIEGLQPTSNGGAVRVNLLPISTFPDGTSRGVVNFTVRIGSGPAAGGPFVYEPVWPTGDPDAEVCSISLTGRQKARCVIADVTASIV